MRNTIAFLMQAAGEENLPVYMTGAGHWDNQDAIERETGYPQYQWIYCIAGEGELVVNGHSSPVKPGTGMFLCPDEAHAYHGVKTPWEVYWITFSGREVKMLSQMAGLHQSGIYGVSSHDLIVNHMRHALHLVTSDKPLAGLECSKIVYMFLIDMIKVMTRHSPSVDEGYLRLEPVLEYMELHYPEHVTLEQLANELDLSISHLCLLFRKIMNKRPMQYLNQLRIHKSKELLLKSADARVGEIALLAGFETPGYFSTLFKRHEGMTPETFRKINRLR